MVSMPNPVPDRTVEATSGPDILESELKPEPVEPTPPEVGCTVAFITSELSIKACPPDRDGLPVVYELHGRGGLMRRAAWGVVLELARQQVGADLGPFVAIGPQPKAGNAAPRVAISGRIL